MMPRRARTIYLVMTGRFFDERIVDCAFTSRALAQSYIDSRAALPLSFLSSGAYSIVEIELDPVQESEDATKG